nr:group II intron maturase-specific domain-containing protein [Pseudomonas sp. H3(2019)]
MLKKTRLVCVIALLLPIYGCQSSSTQRIQPVVAQCQPLDTIKHWRIHRSTTDDLRDFSRRYNAVIRGWIEYYGKFWYRNFSYRLWSALQSRLLKWMKSKYRISIRQAEHRLRLVRKENPELFAHWYLLRASNV